jgi:uncharacterized membrane protein
VDIGRTTNDQRRTKTSLTPRLWSFVTPARLLALGIACYIAVFTAASWFKYDTYQMGFDLGVHEQVLWNTAHGRIAATSAFAETESYLGIDFIPTELLLAPLYALAPSAYTMLFLQTLALALGAVPVFLLVRDRFGSPWAGLVFAAAFLLYLPVEYMNLYEFQIRAFATTLLLMALYAMERRRFVPFLACSLLALGCRSDVGLVLAGMGIYTLLGRPTTNDQRPRDKETRRQGDRDHTTDNGHPFTSSPAHRVIWSSDHLVTRSPGHPSSILHPPSSVAFGLLPIALGLGWFALCLGALIPYFRNGAPSLYLSVIYGQIDGHPWLGDSPGAIFRTLLTRPGFVLQEMFGHATRGPLRLQYLLEMFLPFAFLLLLQPRMLLITLPIFGLNLLSNTPNIHASTHYHYQALIVPFMVVGSAYGLHWLVRRTTTDHRPPTTDHRPPTTDDKETRRQGDKEIDLSAIGYRLSAIGWLLAGVLALGLLCNLVLFAARPFNSRNPALSLLGSALKPSDDRARIGAIERLLAQVPPEAPLTTTNTIGPHAARRERIFFFPGNVIYPAAKIAQGEYLLIDQVDLLQDEKTRAERQLLLADLAASGRYRRLAEDQGISLWQRVAPPAR